MRIHFAVPALQYAVGECPLTTRSYTQTVYVSVWCCLRSEDIDDGGRPLSTSEQRADAPNYHRQAQVDTTS